MNIFQTGLKKLTETKDKFLRSPLWLKIVIVVLILGLGWFIVPKLFGNKSKQPQYQTAQAERGTLVTTVTASGNITAGSAVTITTAATGIIGQVYVKNGDTVTQGQKIADITLDRDSQQRQSAALSSYLSAQTQVNNSRASFYSLQSSLYSKWKTFTDLAENSTYTNPDGSPNTDNRMLPQFTTAQDDWLAAEASFKNQQNAAAQAQAQLTSSWYLYQQLSSAIVAPAAGVVSNLTIAPGLPISSTSNSTSLNNSNSVSTQQIGTITLPGGGVQAVVSLAEIDAAKVNPGAKVTMTLAAFPNRTFTGKVLILNTNGVVSSGVTNYPATIVFDTTEKNMYPNMAVDANIITNVKDNVILVPSAAVQTQSGQSTVRVFKKGQATSVSVQVGDSNDTQTEIVSGINEGDTVVTSATGGTTQTQSSGGSIFGIGGGRGGGGGAFRAIGD